VANAAPESLWGSVLVAAMSAAAVFNTIKGIAGGGKRPQQHQHGRRGQQVSQYCFLAFCS